jgi:hypothetical protein
LANGNTTGGTDISVSTGDDITFADSSKAIFGTDSDLELYHNGSNAFLTNTTGDLYIQDTNGSIRIRPKTGESGIDVLADGAVNLYYDNTSVLSTTADGISVTSEVEADEFIGDLRGAVLFKAQAGEDLTKGDIVYISGISGNTTVVSKAKADDASKMPAFGVASATASNNSSVTIYTFGTLSSIDTSSFSEGDELFVSTTAGAFTNSAPTGESSQIQKIAKVTRSDSSAGSIKIMGAGRSNAVPNLDEDQFFLGNASNQAVATDFSDAVEALSINNVVEDTTPQLGGDLASNGNDILFADSDKAIFGAGNDLRIYSDGTNSFINEHGAGQLYIQATNLRFKSLAGENFMALNENGAVTSYYDNAVKLATTSTGIDVTGEVLADSLDIDGNGDISGNLILGGYLAGPATFTIDPAAVGDNTGTVVIAGNLQVDGTTTTINSTTLTVDDKNITLASGSANAAAANGAGITVDCGSDTDATFTYDGTNDEWDFNKPLNVTGSVGVTNIVTNKVVKFNGTILDDSSITDTGSLITLGTSTDVSGPLQFTSNVSFSSSEPGRIYKASNHGLAFHGVTGTENDFAMFNPAGQLMVVNPTGTNNVSLIPTATGNVGIGTTSPTSFLTNATALEISGGTGVGSELILTNNSSMSANEVVGSLIFKNTDPSGTPNHFAGLRARAQSTFGRMDLEFYAGRSRMEGGTPDMVIISGADAQANVGIGTTSPAMGLHVGNAIGALFGPTTGASTYISPDHENTINGGYGLDSDTGDLWVNYRGYQNGTSRFRDFRVGNGKEGLVAIFDGSTGNVGIGTSSPATKLQISNNGGHTSGNVTISHSSFDLYNPLEANTNEKGSIMTFSDNYYDGTNYIRTTRAGIKGGTDTVGNTADGFLAFYTDSGGANSLIERMRINKDGNVGIGTTNPVAPLTLSGDTTQIRLENTASGGRNWALRTFGSALGIYDHTAGAFRQYIDSSGNVGIGTNNPSHLLSVEADKDTWISRIYNTGSDANAQALLVRSDATAAHDATVMGVYADSGYKMVVKSTGNVGIGTTAPTAKLQVEEYGIDTTETSTTATTQVAIHTMSATAFRSARFTVQVTNSTDSTYHLTEILMIHDGTTPSITEYGTIFTGSAEATFDADISSGNVRLLATPASTDTMEFKVVAHSITT